MGNGQLGAARLRRQMQDQDGVATVRQAKDAGYSKVVIAGKVRRGEWERPAHGVLRTTDHPITPRSRIRVAMLSVGADATLVGRSAAYWWQMTDIAPVEVEVAVPKRSQPRRRPGVSTIRRDLSPCDRVSVDGLQVTKKAATVLAAVAALGLLAGAKFMDRVLQKGLVALDALRESHESSRGRHGAPVCATLLALAAGGARSEAERMAHRVLREAGLTGWEADHRVMLPRQGPAVLDLAFLEQRVLVEIDGWAYHRDLRAFLHDTRRQNALVLAGWVVIRTNWHELKERPDVFVLTVRAALADRVRS